jgi:hypothetical protein
VRNEHLGLEDPVLVLNRDDGVTIMIPNTCFTGGLVNVAELETVLDVTASPIDFCHFWVAVFLERVEKLKSRIKSYLIESL